MNTNTEQRHKTAEN